MRPFAALERFFERLFERPAARIFRARLQPIQLQRRIERAMEMAQLSASDRVLVPNRYVVRLHPADLEAFGELAGGLEADLADAALGFARAHRFTLVDRPQVHLSGDRTMSPGEIRVDPKFVDPEIGRGPSARAVGRPSEGLARQHSPVPASGSSAGEPIALDEWPIPDSRGQTMVFEVPHLDAPSAILRTLGPDGQLRKVVVDGAPLTIGRASDNVLVVRDARVSRYHARLQARRGALVFTDLDSRNGSRVNGTRVGEVVLGEGDRIEIGDTIMTVESTPGG